MSLCIVYRIIFDGFDITNACAECIRFDVLVSRCPVEYAVSDGDECAKAVCITLIATCKQYSVAFLSRCLTIHRIAQTTLSLSLSQSIVKYFDLNTCRRGIRCANQVSSVIHAKWKWGEIRRDLFNYKWLVATLEGHEGGFFTTYNEVIIY